jgi:hypothetical protein
LKLSSYFTWRGDIPNWNITTPIKLRKLQLGRGFYLRFIRVMIKSFAIFIYIGKVQILANPILS